MSEDIFPEEIINEAMIEYLKFADPETKAGLHEHLCEKYLSDSEELLKKEILFRLLKKHGTLHRRFLKR